MKQTARAIIKENNEYVFIRREKFLNGKSKKVYYTTVGGHVEDNETFEETCIREIYEELGLTVEIESLLLELYNSDLDKYEKFYNVKIIEGVLGTGTGPEFTNIDVEKYGKYEIVKINKNDICNYNILPIEIKNILINEKNVEIC